MTTTLKAYYATSAPKGPRSLTEGEREKYAAFLRRTASRAEVP